MRGQALVQAESGSWDLAELAQAVDIVGDGQHVGGRIFSEDEVDKWGVEQRNLGGQAVVFEDPRQLVDEDVGLSALFLRRGSTMIAVVVPSGGVIAMGSWRMMSRPEGSTVHTREDPNW